MDPTVAVVLAAGGGSRYGGPTPKLLAPVDGALTVLDLAVRAPWVAGFPHVGVVVGALGVDALEGTLLAEGADGVEVLANPRWAEGQATSLQVAVAWARSLGAPALTVGLGDQPGLSPAAWRAVASATGTPLAVATYAGRRGHPVRLAAEVWDLLPTEGDRGARDLLRSRPDLVTEVPCDGDPTDVDTEADLTAWRHRHRS